MSRILFWYILKDLLRIFILTCFGLAGIMSFAGLLRPLTQQGLDGAQVGQLLFYFLPAMMTYSLPVAAVFAATMVYGRLAADNELTACRAAGISYLSMATPAVVLGLTVAITSLLLLCFVVPVASLRIERVIYSNLAQLLANRIGQNNQMRFGAVTIFAERAHLPTLTPQQRAAGSQIVILDGPMIVTYESPDREHGGRRPREFYMAREAQVHIRQNFASDEVTLEVLLEAGSKFPRRLGGGVQAGIEATQFGPVPLPSPVKESTKFMDIFQLQALHEDSSRSRAVNTVRLEFVRAEQASMFWEMMMGQLLHDADALVLRTGDAEGAEVFRFIRGPLAPIPSGGLLVLPGDPASPRRQVRMLHENDGQLTLSADAREIRLEAWPDNERGRMFITATMLDTMMLAGEQRIPRASFNRTFSVPMPHAVAQLSNIPAEHFIADQRLDREHRLRLQRELLVLRNQIQAELHSRASFAVSCLILVMIGCALGMMFRSGHFLSAFALSVAPALVSITLIVTGQRTAGAIPWSLEPHSDPLALGIALIWGGNLAVLAIAMALWWKLQRQ